MVMKPSLAQTEHPNDAELARRVVAGDRRAQQLLFSQLKGAVHATLYRVLGSNLHMEDLLQESFIEVFRSLASYRGEAKLATWADRIAVRVAFHYLRRQSTRRVVEREAEPPAHLRVVRSPEDNAEHRQGVARMYAMLGRLKPEYRIAFALFALDGRSIEEVADITGVTSVAAKSRIARARQKLWAAARHDDVLAGYLTGQFEGELT
jgi:RNA polymerase sigma-70 factor (ECF subfamily)